MSSPKQSKPKARLPRGFRDRGAAEIMAEQKMLATIRSVYESYGFEPLETPAFEYTDALGKFLPDVDRPNEGVFSLKDDDEQWMSLRYDLTAPLARHVAANFQNLPKPFRRYQTGTVWRNEKPGPGRYREFTQFDADTVGSASASADAELLMMLCDTLEALGLERGEYVIKLNSRKLLDGLLETLGLGLELKSRGVVLRAVDKLDRLGPAGVFDLLRLGRKDESGDFTPGAGLTDAQADNVMRFLGFSGHVNGPNFRYERDKLLDIAGNNKQRLSRLEQMIQFGPTGIAGLIDLAAINYILDGAGYGADRIQIDQTVVRGLDYYTGAVFEAQLTFPVKNEDGDEVVFGSVAGGGRYDDLVARFTGQAVPATGVSIGVSRLLRAITSRGFFQEGLKPLILVTVMDDPSDSFSMAAELRKQKYRVEVYSGNKKLQDQLKYADKRGAMLCLIAGGDERKEGTVVIKDMQLGAELAKSIESRAAWIGDQPAQFHVQRENLISEVKRFIETRARSTGKP